MKKIQDSLTECLYKALERCRSGILTKLAVAETKVSVAETNVSAAETNVSVAETNVSAVETNVSVAETKVSMAETKVSFTAMQRCISLPKGSDSDSKERLLPAFCAGRYGKYGENERFRQATAGRSPFISAIYFRYSLAERSG